MLSRMLLGNGIPGLYGRASGFYSFEKENPLHSLSRSHQGSCETLARKHTEAFELILTNERGH